MSFLTLQQPDGIFTRGAYVQLHRGSTNLHIAAVAVCSAIVLAVVMGGCSGRQQSPTDTAATSEAVKEISAMPAGASADDLPPILKAPWRGDLDQIAKRRVVRVLVPFRRPEFFYMEGRPAGILQEAFQEIEKLLNLKYKTNAANRIVVALLPTPIDRMREKMAGGWGDIAAGSISITEQNKSVVDFTVPVMTGLKIVPVTGPSAPALSSIDDLSGKEIWVMPQTRMGRDLEDLNTRLKVKGKAPAKIRAADAVLEPGDVMELVNAGVYPIALMQSGQADFWAQVFDQIHPRKDLALAEDVQLGWAIQKATPQLQAFLNDFLGTHGVGTAFGNTLMRRYMKDAKYVRNAIEASELRKFRATIPHFKKYSSQYNLDALLMAAQGYQESRLDQSVKSRVGAVGIMQVLPSTAASSPVKIKNIDSEENNIHAGVRLMHYLIEDHFNEPQIDLFNRMLFAFAAYNAGPARIERCRAMAKEMGYDPNKWFGNVEAATAKVVGRETTQYVANIYKYYVAYRLAGEILQKRQQAEQKAAKASS